MMKRTFLLILLVALLPATVAAEPSAAIEAKLLSAEEAARLAVERPDLFDAVQAEIFAAAQAKRPAEQGRGVPSPAPTNVMQDCWTTSLALDPDVELELYDFDITSPIDFIWKHKIIAGCSAYVVRIFIFECIPGKPSVVGNPILFVTAPIPFGPVSPIPGIPEIIFPPVTLAPGTLPSGMAYDWVVVTECDDTDGAIGPDGDIVDSCGANLGFVLGGPLILGPEPIGLWDPDPGGSPPGRGPGENGTTRPWCFSVTGSPPTP